MKPKTMDQYVQEHVDLAAQWLKDHVILCHEQNERVGIVEVGNRSGSSVHRCELMLVTHSGHLVMTGDHDTICWARYQGGGGVAGAIAWMARSGVCGYVREKASIGMGQIGVEDWSAEVALDQALDYLREAKEEATVEARAVNEVELWLKVIDMIRDCAHQQKIIEHIADHDSDCERLDLGVVPSQRLLWGWSIVKKADELLRNK